MMNVSDAVSLARFGALLIAEQNGLGLESALREQGCAVRRAELHAVQADALEKIDLLVISATGAVDDDVMNLVRRAKAAGSSVLVATDNVPLAVKALKLGASTVRDGALDLAAATMGQLLARSERRHHSQEPAGDALDALIAAAVDLVPMDRFQRVYVEYALRRFGGNKVHTAAALGIDRRTIQRWARARAGESTASPTMTAPATTSN